MAEMERVNQERCGLCLYFQSHSLDSSKPLNFNSELGICIFHKSLKGVLISEDLTPRQTLSVYGLNSILSKMLFKGTTCFKFGGPRMEIASMPLGETTTVKPNINIIETLPV